MHMCAMYLIYMYIVLAVLTMNGVQIHKTFDAAIKTQNIRKLSVSFRRISNSFSSKYGSQA